MGPPFMDYPSPRGVHVPETDDDPYRRDGVVSPRRNRYSRSSAQTPRTRDVTWISSPEQMPQTPLAPSPWALPPHVPSSPARPPTPRTIPPSPAPTVGEHMTLDDIVLMPEALLDPYRPQRTGSQGGLMKSLWRGLKKLSGRQSSMPMPMPEPPYMPHANSYVSETVEVSAPGLSASEGTHSQYAHPTPTESEEEEEEESPYASPYMRPARLGATPAGMPPRSLVSFAPMPVPSPAMGRPRSPSPAPMPVPSPAMEPPPITVVSPSIPPSPLPGSVRSVRYTHGLSPSIVPSPLPGSVRSGRMPTHGLSPATPMPEPAPPVEEGSQTLHEAEFPTAPDALALAPVDDPTLVRRDKALAFDMPRSSSGSLLSTMARVRRFVAGLEGLPWVSDTQIAEEYIPERNPRSRMRHKMRQGTEPSWYNPRPEVMERPEYWSEWDMWAKQSAATMWVDDAGHPVQWGGVGGPVLWPGMPMYPHGYAPMQPGFVPPPMFPAGGQTGHMPVIP